MSRVAIMQPYLFPYLGYYQLAFHVDTFVFLDDVNFIKSGYIHRNVVRDSGLRPVPFSLSVRDQSSNRTIREHEFFPDSRKVLATIAQGYSKCPEFETVFPVIEAVFSDKNRNVAHLAARSITAVFEYLGLERQFHFSCDLGNPGALRGQDRVLDLCRVLQATEYVNAIGGTALYDDDSFSNIGVKLGFIRMIPDQLVYGRRTFEQFSMIDVLMACPRDVVLKLLTHYEVISSAPSRESLEGSEQVRT